MAIETEKIKKDINKKLDIYRKRYDKAIKSPKQRKYIYIAAILIVVGGLVYLLKSFIFAGFVNGQPVMRYTIVRELEAQGGAQVLDNMITKTLIMQEARKQNALPTEDEITSEIDSIKAELEGQGLDLETALAQQGQTMDSLRENVQLQLAIEKMVGGDTEISQEDVDAYFEENADFYGEDATIEDVQADIEETLRQEALSGKYQELITRLRNEAQIHRFVDY